MSLKKNEYREKMAEIFIESLSEVDANNWIKPWKGTAPYNGSSNRVYNGSNKFFLMLISKERGYEDPRWFTYNQITENDYKLVNAKGMGIPVQYWFPIENQTKKIIGWNEYNKLSEEDKKDYSISFKTSYVFNAEHIEGLPKLEENKVEIKMNEIVEKISKNMEVSITNDGGDRSFYSKSTDSIHMPEANKFTSETAYNSTLLHELSHASGHESRLNRLKGCFFGDETYAYEELVAEISSTFMGEYIGELEHDEKHIQNHLAYVKSWTEAIKKDPEVLFKAIDKANQCSDYLEYKAELITKQEYIDRTPAKYISRDLIVEEHDLKRDQEEFKQENDLDIFKQKQSMSMTM